MTFQSRDRFTIGQDRFVTPATPKHTPRPSIGRRVAATVATWRARVAVRRHLAQLDARTLRDIGVAPAVAAFEAGKPFWKKMAPLR